MNREEEKTTVAVNHNTKPRRAWRWLRSHPLVFAVLVVAIIVGFVLLPDQRPDSSPSDRARYERIRATCIARVTNDFSTGTYTVGGSRWVDAVNDCMVDAG